MFCPNCGNEINDNSKFCPYCGSQLSVGGAAQAEAAAPASNPEPSAYQQTFVNPNPQPAYQQPQYQQPYTAPTYAAPVAQPRRARVGGVVTFSAIGFVCLVLNCIITARLYGGVGYYISNVYGIVTLLELICIIVFLFALIKVKPNLAFIPPSVYFLTFISTIYSMLRYQGIGISYFYNILMLGLCLFHMLSVIFFAASINPNNRRYRSSRVFATIFIIILLLIIITYLALGLIQLINVRFESVYSVSNVVSYFGRLMLTIAMLIGTYSLRTEKQ